MPTARMTQKARRFHEQVRGDRRGVVLAFVQLPGVDVHGLAEPDLIRSILDAAYASTYFPSGPFAYVPPPTHLQTYPDRIGGTLVHDDGDTYLEGRFAFHCDDDVVASWIFTRGRPGRSGTHVLAADAEATLVEACVIGTMISTALGYDEPLHLRIDVTTGDPDLPVVFEALDDAGRRYVSAPDLRIFTPVDVQVPARASLREVYECLRAGSDQISRQFGAEGAQFAVVVHPEELRGQVRPEAELLLHEAFARRAVDPAV